MLVVRSPTATRRPRSSAPSLAEAMGTHSRGLDVVRLALALAVVVWHSWSLTGSEVTSPALRHLAATVPVDGFFAASGYLVVDSWRRRPDVVAFVRARAFRLLPAFWTSLALTALVIAPVALLTSGRGLPVDYWRTATAQAVSNSALWVSSYDLAATPTQVPFPLVWNGSTWTIWWEASCYLLVLVLGITGALRRVRAPYLLLAAAWSLVVVLGAVEVAPLWLHGSRLLLLFAAGAVVLALREQLPVRADLVLVAALVVVGSAWLPDPRLVAALPLAYLVLAGSTYVATTARPGEGTPRRTDLSYGTYIFAFPIQQALAVWGLWRWGPVPFAVVSVVLVLPVALLSWRLVEEPALRRGARRRSGTGPAACLPVSGAHAS